MVFSPLAALNGEVLCVRVCAVHCLLAFAHLSMGDECVLPHLVLGAQDSVVGFQAVWRQSQHE